MVASNVHDCTTQARFIFLFFFFLVGFFFLGFLTSRRVRRARRSAFFRYRSRSLARFFLRAFAASFAAFRSSFSVSSIASGSRLRQLHSFLRRPAQQQTSRTTLMHQKPALVARTVRQTPTIIVAMSIPLRVCVYVCVSE